MIKFGRPTGFFWAYDSVFERKDVPAYGKLVYLYLCRRANADGKSIPSYQTIADDCGLSRRTAIRAIKELETIGLLVITKRKRENNSNTSNLYLIFPPHEPFRKGEERINENGQIEQVFGSDSQTLGGSDSQSPGWCPTVTSGWCPTVTTNKESHFKESYRSGNYKNRNQKNKKDKNEKFKRNKEDKYRDIYLT